LPRCRPGARTLAIRRPPRFPVPSGRGAAMRARRVFGPAHPFQQAERDGILVEDAPEAFLLHVTEHRHQVEQRKPYRGRLPRRVGEVRPWDWTSGVPSLWYGGGVGVTTANQLNLDSLDRKP